MKKLRIFISSPGDVQQERTVAKKVITQLNRTFSKHIELEALLWEDMPLLSTSSFQEGIDQIVNKYAIDIAVFILWSRLGSTLGKKYTKKDGSLYTSGTEYEYDMMMESFRRQGTPMMLVYVKDSPIRERLVHLTKENEIEDALQQHKAVKNFVHEHFHDASTGSNYAYTSFGESVSFESRLKSHLTNIILDRIGTYDDIIEWDESPYVGLDSFETKQSPIFFGRGKAISDIMPFIFSSFDNKESPSLILLGESGSGKSSFVKAGIIPLLDNIEGKRFKVKTTTPSVLGNNLYTGLIDIIFDSYPQLKDNPVYSELLSGISENYNFAHLQYAIQHYNNPISPILFIDQFEELFTDTRITEEQRILVLRILCGIVASKCLFLILAMRNDFYPKFNEYVDLNSIKEMVTMCYDMPPMKVSEFAEVVREPARMAGLKWEVSKDGESLDSRIINDASRIGDLPLIEFALSELYKHKSNDNVITYSTYDNLGGLDGAFRTYVDAIYNSLNDEEKTIFHELLGRLITVSSINKNVFVRKFALYDECNRSVLHQTVIKKLVDTHVFVSGKNAHGQATLTIVHEMLIKKWDVIATWIQQERKHIESNNYYENLAQHWIDSGKSKSMLIKDDETLLKAEYFDYHWHSKISIVTLEFLKKSFKYKSNLAAIRWSIYLIAYLTLMFFIIKETDWFGGNVGKNIFDTVSSFLLIIPISMNLVVHLQHKPLYLESTKIFKTWIIFSIIWIIDTLLGFHVDKKDYLTLPQNWYIVILEFVLFLLATIKSFSDYYTRKKWKRSMFKVPFWTKIFNKEKYRIATTIISAFYVIILGLLFVLILSLINENSKVETAKANAELLHNFVENADNEIGLNTNLFYHINILREEYLKTTYYDSVDINASPNDKKYELARTFYYRSMPDSVIVYLTKDTICSHQCLKALAYAQKGLYKDAASCLPKDPERLLNNFFQRMSVFDPLDIFIMAGDNKSAEQYGNSLISIFNNVNAGSEGEALATILGWRINASLEMINGNMNLASENYMEYTQTLLLSDYSDFRKYLAGLLNEIDNTLRPIPLSQYVYAGVLSYNNAKYLIDKVNSETNKILKENKIKDTCNLTLDISDCENHTRHKTWPVFLNGKWSVSIPREEGYCLEVDVVFNDNSMRTIELKMNSDDTTIVNHFAVPCRFIENNGVQIIESINGDNFIVDNEKGTLFLMSSDTIEFKKNKQSSTR